MFVESEWSRKLRAVRQTEENRKIWLRRRMIDAEERGDKEALEEYQRRYVALTGERFETAI